MHTDTPAAPSMGLLRQPWVWLLGVVMVGGLVHMGLYLLPFEDAYISFRYAENLGNGHGFVFNPGGPPVEGFTSFGWVVLLALVHLLGGVVPDAAVAVSVCCGLGLLGLTAVLTARWQGRVDAWIVLPPALLAANGTWAYWSASGMETPLFVLLVAGAVLLATRSSRRSAILTAIVLGLAAMVRPEGAGYAVAVIAALLSGRESRKRGLWILGGFALVFVPWFVWRWQHFGFPLPNTVYVKSSLSSEQTYLGWRYVEECLTSHGYWLVLPALAAGVWRRTWDVWSRLVAFVLGANLVNAIVVGGDIFPFYRFLLPAQVLGLVILVDGIRRLVAWTGVETAGLRNGLAAGACVLLGMWMLGAGSAPRRSLHGTTLESHHTRIKNVDRMNADYQAIGMWLGQTFPKETVVALNAAGIVPYESGLPTIDMLGLNDSHIAHVDVEPGKGALGHEKHDAKYVLSLAPDVVILGLPTLSIRTIPTTQVGNWFAKWWPFLPGDKDMILDETFQRDYNHYSAQVGLRGWLTFFIRRGSEPTQLGMTGAEER